MYRFIYIRGRIKFKKIGVRILFPDSPGLTLVNLPCISHQTCLEYLPLTRYTFRIFLPINFLQAIAAFLRESKDVLQRASCYGGPRAEPRRPVLLI
jgi:hypothetical protein